MATQHSASHTDLGEDEDNDATPLSTGLSLWAMPEAGLITNQGWLIPQEIRSTIEVFSIR